MVVHHEHRILVIRTVPVIREIPASDRSIPGLLVISRYGRKLS